MTRMTLILTTLTLPLPAFAQVPRVMTDIAPVHSLVAQVMGDLGAPDLLVEPGADAHHMTLRPSVARQLEDADLVVQVGPQLTPWLAAPLDALADTASTLVLLDTDGWTHRMIAGAEHGTHGDHNDGDSDGAENNGHDHDSHAHDSAGHDHGDLDPHAWLDPQVAVVWIQAIRNALTVEDPENEATYAANADTAMADLTALQADVADLLATGTAGRWLAPHDAFGYFEERFDFASAGAVADSEAAAPGPAHLGDLRARVQDGGVNCVLTETNGNENRAETLVAGTTARTAQISDTGAGLTPGPGLYDALLRQIATTVATCTAP